MIASPETREIEPRLTPASEPKGLEVSPSEATVENLYLNGRPTMKDFIRYVRSHAVHPPREGILVEEWQAANDMVRALEQEEAGCADHPPINRVEVNSKYESLLTELLKDYFNPKLRKVMPVRRRLHQVTVEFEVDEFSVPALDH